MRTAVVIGSTGLIGEDLVERLGRQGTWSQVLAISRKAKTWANPKVRTVAFDFVNWAALEVQISSFAGSSPLDFFCCLGTTMNAAGSRKEFKKIDLEAVASFAVLAQRCRAEQLLVVSALGANPESDVFYNRIKGEAEQAVLKRFAGELHFLRPSLLLGDRKEFRLLERLAMLIAPIYSPFLLGSLAKYKPIESKKVAQIMVIVAARLKTAPTIIENEEIHKLSRLWRGSGRF
jgi:uncharacterized protein YbjT (DUF2867 family)